MRMNRGSGVAGLAGVRERTWVPGAEALLVRPALGWRRAELAEAVALRDNGFKIELARRTILAVLADLAGEGA